MNTFANAVANQEARTENGMKARKSTSNACVDLFYNIGASRGKDIVPQFAAAFAEDPDLATRIALWARDVREGAGERQLFRDIFNYLEKLSPEHAVRVLYRIPELGRWDDVLVAKTAAVISQSFRMVEHALSQGDGLCAKWMPRKGQLAAKLREALHMSPKTYRKTLVNLTNVVETLMCSKQWDSIEFDKLPSLAASRYRNAFSRNTPKFKEYVEALTKGEAKVNTGAVYPYDVLKSIIHQYGLQNITPMELDFIVAQWEALPNYMGDAKVLPMIDVSGSMYCPAGGGSLQCVDVAVSLGLYCADKNTGAFKDLFLTFSGNPQLVKASGNIASKVAQTVDAEWGMNTNLIAAMDKILSVAIKGKVSQEEMPDYLVIFSDMQFDQCTRFDDSAMEAFERRFSAAGYKTPKIVFWNLNAKGSVPVRSTESGVALVSGFSPNLMKAVLGGDLEEFTPEAIMNKTVMTSRYAF